MPLFIKCLDQFFDLEQVERFRHYIWTGKNTTQLQIYFRGRADPITFSGKDADAIFAKLKESIKCDDWKLSG